MTLASFILFLLIFTGIGIASSLQKQDSTEDYLVAGRNVPAWLTALSSVATNNSGFMFIGLIGFTFRDGVSTVWMALAWVLGDLCAWLWVHRRVRERSGAIDANSVPALLGDGKQGVQRPLVVLTGVLTFLFLGGYAAAQLNAGSIALHELFGLPYWMGATGGAVIVVAYCFSGGLRASIWTDAAQAFVMLAAMILLLAMSANQVGGPWALFERLEAIDPSLVSLLPPGLFYADSGSGAWLVGLPLYFLGFLAGGFGAVGQPHILIRSMAIESADAITSARRTYFAWFIPFYIAAIFVALYARVLMPELMTPPDGLTGDEARQAVTAATEGALPALALALLPDVLVGFTLAGLFSATMSTADSQILACSAAVTQDVVPSLRHSTWASKLATLSVTGLALIIALRATEGVFALALGAWSTLAGSLGPLLVLRVFRVDVPAPVAGAMVVSGLLTSQLWGWLPYTGGVFVALPAMLVPSILFLGWRATASR